MRYFFDVIGPPEMMDAEGVECTSLDAAVREATKAASDMSAELLEGGTLAISIRDEIGPTAKVSVTVAIQQLRG